MTQVVSETVLDTNSRRSHRQPGLDGLRGIAILLVILSHSTFIRSGVLGARDSLAFKIARVIPDLGWTGVDIFFVLSGFLITTILVEARGQAHFFRNFYARRALRIVPLYYAVIAFSFYVLPHLGAVGAGAAPTHDSQWQYWLFLANYHLARQQTWPSHALQVTWSLSIEEQFYLVWPLAVFLLNRRLMICFCVAIIAGAIAIRAAAVFTGHGGMVLYTSTLCRMDSLAIGGTVALLAMGRGGIARWKLAGTFGLPLSVAGIVAVIAHDRRSFWANGGAGQTIGYTLLATAAGSALILVLASKKSAFARAMSFPPLMLVGRLSYCMYLVHPVICGFLYEAMFPSTMFQGEVPTVADSIWLAQITYIVAAVGATMAVAWISWVSFERWFLSLKRFFPMPVAEL